MDRRQGCVKLHRHSEEFSIYSRGGKFCTRNMAFANPEPPAGCALSPLPFSRGVIGSTTDFGSVSFGSSPDGKAEVKK